MTDYWKYNATNNTYRKLRAPISQDKKDEKHARLRKLVRMLLDCESINEMMHEDQLELMKLSNWKEKK